MVDSSAASMGRIISDDKDKMRMFPLKINHFGKDIKINCKQVTSKPKDFNAEYPRHCVTLDTITAHCERFNRTLQDELLDDNLYDLKGT